MEAMGAVAVAYRSRSSIPAALMIGMGSASVLSRAIGAKDQRTIDQVMGNLVVMNLVLSLTVTIVGTVFARRCWPSPAHRAESSTWPNPTCASCSSAACS